MVQFRPVETGWPPAVRELRWPRKGDFLQLRRGAFPNRPLRPRVHMALHRRRSVQRRERCVCVWGGVVRGAGCLLSPPPPATWPPCSRRRSVWKHQALSKGSVPTSIGRSGPRAAALSVPRGAPAGFSPWPAGRWVKPQDDAPLTLVPGLGAPGRHGRPPGSGLTQAPRETCRFLRTRSCCSSLPGLQAALSCTSSFPNAALALPGGGLVISGVGGPPCHLDAVCDTPGRAGLGVRQAFCLFPLHTTQLLLILRDLVAFMVSSEVFSESVPEHGGSWALSLGWTRL